MRKVNVTGGRIQCRGGDCSGFVSLSPSQVKRWKPAWASCLNSEESSGCFARMTQLTGEMGKTDAIIFCFRCPQGSLCYPRKMLLTWVRCLRFRWLKLQEINPVLSSCSLSFHIALSLNAVCLLCMCELLSHVSVYMDMSVYNMFSGVADATLFCANIFLCLESFNLFVQVRFFGWYWLSTSN